MISRRPLSLVAVLALALAAPTPSRGAPPPPASADVLTREIAIYVNDQHLEPQPAPRVVNGHVLVPIVRILGALAISVTRRGTDLIAAAPNKTLRLRIGSTRAYVDDRPIVLETPPVEIGGTTYVPLRFVADALGASVSYNAQSARIDIVSALVRRETASQDVGSGKVKITGSLAAIDLRSEPPTVTVAYRDSARTISINSTAKIVVQDVVARSQQNGKLADLRVGDAVAVTMNKDGSVELIQDMFGSRTGTVAAVSPTAIVLDNGRVITPDKTTEITLNGDQATLDDIRVGDAVTQRSNPETGETREIIVTRRAGAAAASPAPGASPAAAPSVASAKVAIDSLSVDPGRPLRYGETFTFTLRGTPGGKATYDVGTFLLNVPMTEESPGVYVGTLKVDAGMNFLLAPVYGHLTIGGVEAARAESRFQISAATIPPQITEVAPANGQVVNNNRPSIYATFAAPTDLGISAASVRISVNGKDVTSASTRTTSFATYNASDALADGPVTVSVSVSDLAGNTASRSWTFTIRTR